VGVARLGDDGGRHEAFDLGDAALQGGDLAIAIEDVLKGGPQAEPLLLEALREQAALLLVELRAEALRQASPLPLVVVQQRLDLAVLLLDVLLQARQLLPQVVEGGASGLRPGRRGTAVQPPAHQQGGAEQCAQVGTPSPHAHSVPRSARFGPWPEACLYLIYRGRGVEPAFPRAEPSRNT
jgi:hypothetical protein